jgi:metal-dependent hydrolase (beta-lactamase superfamily II)
VPDAKTIWLFREQLTRAEAISELFATFEAHLKARGHLAMSGQIIDASIIAAPRQRNGEAEKRSPSPSSGTRTTSPLIAAADGQPDLIPDQFQDEIAIAFNVRGRGLVMLTSCSHRGVVNAIRQAGRQQSAHRLAERQRALDRPGTRSAIAPHQRSRGC